MLTVATNHPPKSREHLSLFLTSSEPLHKVPNSEFRAFKEWVQDKSNRSLQTILKSAREMNGRES